MKGPFLLDVFSRWLCIFLLTLGWSVATLCRTGLSLGAGAVTSQPVEGAAQGLACVRSRLKLN